MVLNLPRGPLTMRIHPTFKQGYEIISVLCNEALCLFLTKQMQPAKDTYTCSHIE